ncbi:MAG TPA: dephospho-CoA kinase [Candidatus Acidoferrales bacterium]|nr:dephospho-CoA kinase [Candidatus Acidoferrales bacterium]
MLTVGLTGGIASGKTTVARVLKEYGCTIIEADLLAHEYLKLENPVATEVITEYGRDITDATGNIDRGKLGEIVFGDAEKLKRLDAIIHPHVLREITRQLKKLAEPGGPAIAVVVAALHIESGYYKNFDRLAVAWCTREQQIERAMGRGLTRGQAEKRIASQMAIDEKRKFADDLIDCSQTLAETRRQTEEALAHWKKLV